MSDPEPQLGAAAETIRRARAIEDNDWAGAIDALVTADHAAPDAELEIELAALRHRSYDRLASVPPSVAPAAPGKCPPIGARGLPEATLADLNAADLRAAIVEHGSLLVPAAVDGGRARELADSIDECFEVADSWTPGRRGTRWWSPLRLDDDNDKAALGRKWVRGAGGALLCDSPRMQFELLDLYTKLGLRAVVGEYLGSRPVLSANKCTLRRVTLDATGGWHQDGAFLGSGIRAINLWLTLSDCGVDAPGLDLVPRRFDGVIETGTSGSYFDWASGDDVVRDAAGPAGIVRPEFAAGDLLIFDDLFLHRTAVSPTMTKERHAIETWSFAADAYPSGQVPLVW